MNTLYPMRICIYVKHKNSRTVPTIYIVHTAHQFTHNKSYGEKKFKSILYSMRSARFEPAAVAVFQCIFVEIDLHPTPIRLRYTYY